MKKYDEIIKKEVFVCNCCGELIAAVDESDRAAFLDVRKAWGYFSKWEIDIVPEPLAEGDR